MTNLSNTVTLQAIESAPSDVPQAPSGVEVSEGEKREKRRDYVRAVVTIGLLVIFAYVVVWACIESASWPKHWEQTKEMLQVILPAITGLIGSALGFYFGAGGRIGGDQAGKER